MLSYDVQTHETKLRGSRVGNQQCMIPAKIEVKEKNMFFHFGFDRALIDAVKTQFERRKWHGPPINPDGPKIWSAPITQRNWFRLEYLKAQYGCNPYARYDKDHKSFIPKVYEYCEGRGLTPYDHQADMVAHALAVRHFIWAAEMGTGKTLSAFIALEMSGFDDVWWVGPKSALRSTYEEIKKWNLQLEPRFMTFDELKKVIKNWQDGEPAPQALIIDEVSRCKNARAQRSVAVKHVADSIRAEHGLESLIGGLSGSPAPKAPTDWWHLCEIACPGFLAEANEHLLRKRLGIVEQRESVRGGGSYPHLVAWRDSPDKCDTCGKDKSHKIHTIGVMGYHPFQPGSDEVSRLAKRMKGLVLVKLKHECLDLPEKIYERRILKPTPDIINAAKLIVSSSTRAIEALTKLRTLSDGFQYVDKEVGEDDCPVCDGCGECYEFYDPDQPDDYIDQEFANQGFRIIYDDEGEVIGEKQVEFQQRLVQCFKCHGKCKVPRYDRTLITFPCPKDDTLREDLDLHSEVGRLNIYAGFTGSVDRVVGICHKEGWSTIRVDGRGWHGVTPVGEIMPNDQLLEIFDRGHDLYPRVAFVGQPGAAGMGLTLTASPTTVFWSNDFNGESRIQAEDRGHRIGMDRERGGRIVDYIHLESDLYVLENLLKKKDLQKQSMTGINQLFKGK